MTDQPAAAEQRESTESATEGDTTPSQAATSADAESSRLVAPRSDGSRNEFGDDWTAVAHTSLETTTADQTEPRNTSSAKPSGSSEPADPSSGTVTSKTDSHTIASTGPVSTSDVESSSNPTPSESTFAETTEPPPVDECPEQETQLSAGSCGCGHASEPMCDALRTALSHRYSFVSHAAQVDFDATTIPDSVGSADGKIHDAEFDWDGSLLLNGHGSFVELPPRLLSTHTETTLDFWLKWWGGGDSQRLLNFGLAPNDSDDAPDNYLSISPSGSNGVLTVQYRTNEGRGDRLETDDPLETTELQHVTVVIREQSLSLFVNGKSEAAAETPHRLGELDDDDNWLGRALYSGYPLYNGAFFEFRVFSRALSNDEVAKLDELGLELP